MPLLEVRDLTVHYRLGPARVHAADRVSFTLDRGQTLGLVGESGCGKTTVGYALLRVLPENGVIAGGQVHLDGSDLLALDAEAMRRVRWRRLSMIFQGAMNALNPVLRVGDLLEEILQTHEPVSREEARARVAEQFEQVGLPRARTHSYPHEMSGGQRQRAVKAKSHLGRPDLIIADEPTTAFDVILQDQILVQLQEIQKRLGLALILISHDMSVIAETCDHVAVMYGGRIVEYGTVDEIFARPRHPYTIAMLSSFPSLYGPARELLALPGVPPDLTAPPVGCAFAPRCPLAEERCHAEAPAPLTLDGDETHWSRCHFAREVKVSALAREAAGAES
ncbi:MAG: ABC transporter ATP-binding protein [Armatimonadetes bacterium]|nr:ABC transporter ATP-binding protein [Armatimonadota bacterium]